MESNAGLPDGLFPDQKSRCGRILEGLAMEDVGIFNGHASILLPLDIFMVVWHIL
jgi:hypothetical protein